MSTSFPGHSADSMNALRYVKDAYEDEPLFVIRGRDWLAIPAIINYQGLTETNNLPEMTSQVGQHLIRFSDWTMNNPKLMKYPDAYPGWIK